MNVTFHRLHQVLFFIFISVLILILELILLWKKTVITLKHLSLSQGIGMKALHRKTAFKETSQQK